MKRDFYFKVFFLIFCFFLSITSISAKECTTEEVRELKQLAEKIEISYEFQEETENLNNKYFLLTGHNLNKKIYFEIEENSIFFNKSKEVIGLYDEGKKINIKMYASDKTNCVDEYLNKIEIELPYYNRYSENEKCLIYKNLDVCKKWYDTSKMTEQEFLDVIGEASKSQKKSVFFEMIAFIIKQYGIFMLGAVLLAISFILIYKKIKDSRKQKIEM